MTTTTAGTGKPRRRISTRPRQLNVGTIVGLGIAMVFFLFPVYWMVATSLKPPSQWTVNPPVFIPTQPHWRNYTDALFKYNAIKGLVDSAVVSVTATILGMVVGTLAGYSIARFRTGGNQLSFFILSALFLPPVAIGIPMFVFWSRLGLVDTYTALVVEYLVFTIPFVTWVMRSFFEDIPPALEESAMVNGASRLRAFVGVVLPTARPALVSTALFAFIFNWNEFTYAVLLSRSRITTLPFILPTLMESHYVLWGDIASMAVIGALPVVVLAFILQRYLVRGLSFGAVQAGGS